MVSEAQIALGVFGAILLLIILASSIRIVREYERAVFFRLGRLLPRPKGPGLFFRIPIIDTLRVIDLRVVTFDVPRQRAVTRDNVTLDVDAVVYYRVLDPLKAVNAVENYRIATNLLAQTTLRDVLGQVELDELLAKRDELGKRLTTILDAHTDAWGIKVVTVAIRDVVLPENIQRAIAKQAEAERERRSRIIIADGEFQASAKMSEAAAIYENTPVAFRLRELQTMQEIAREKNLIVITTTGGGTSSDMATLIGLIKGAQKEKGKE